MATRASESSDQRRLASLEPPKRRIKAVIDTDTFNEIDDQFALVYSLLSPESMDGVAVHACPFFNSKSSGPADGMAFSYREICRVLDLVGRNPDGLPFRGVTECVGLHKEARQGDAVDHLIELADTFTPEDPLFVVPIGAISIPHHRSTTT